MSAPVHRPTVAWFASAVLLAAGCQTSTILPDPLAGPSPESILVWPQLGEAAAGRDAVLCTGLDAALRSRGYRVPGLAVGREILSEHGLLLPGATEPEDLLQVGQKASVDAVLCVDVRRFEAGGANFRAAHWDLGWRLVSTRGHGVLWSYDHAGSWRRADLDERDPYGRHDAPLQAVPIGGGPTPNFRDVADLANWLHRMAMAHLPVRTR